MSEDATCATDAAGSATAINEPNVEQQAQGNEEEQHVILFYKFHPLSGERKVVDLYRAALENLCSSLQLQGRILVGCNEHQSEGINGTLSGKLINVQAFTRALTTEKSMDNDYAILETYWKECEEFYKVAKCEPLIMDQSEFKWSTTEQGQLFPDLNIKIVNELIGTGGVLASIPLTDVHQGYLTPQQWHERITKLQQQQAGNSNDTVLIDCRNTKEWQIGHFPGAIDPNTTTFNQFPTWVQQHSQSLSNKKVLMYCTGGIRCEKASAYIRQQIPTVQEVCHLKGGIHKYLDEYGSQQDNLWMGKNFVFDGRVAQGTGNSSTADVPKASSKPSDRKETNNGNPGAIVGSCTYCAAPFDSFDPGCVCTVCREPTLVCWTCRPSLHEFHCKNHQHLKTCYFTSLANFSKSDLEQQLKELQTLIQDIAVGKKFRQKRKTLYKQCEKIMQRLEELDEEPGNPVTSSTSTSATGVGLPGQVELKCRNCGETGCPGRCWGFHGLKRKRMLEQQQTKDTDRSITSSVRDNKASSKNKNNNAHLQEQKKREEQARVKDLKRLKLAEPPSVGRDPDTGIRVPAPCTRTLQTKTKGKWCGMALLSVLQEEFSELSNTEYLSRVMERGLIRVNDDKITTLEQAENLRLKNMDVISRIVHWHEPPVHIPTNKIGVTKVSLPKSLQDEFNISGNDEDACVYVCDKPSSVPVHPAGPYLSNSMTMMIEAQEGLEPRSLIPCHRIDRVTSGMTLCCTKAKVARMIQGRIDEGLAQKQYLARVVGKFPKSPSQTDEDKGFPSMEPSLVSPNNASTKWSWQDASTMSKEDEKHGPCTVLVDAPIETVDPANGIRKITPEGKASQSLFQLLSYDATTDTSILVCTPLTGRSHQLRVHLQYLGYPIVNDVLYGGGKNNKSTSSSAGMVQLTKSIQNSQEDLKSDTLSAQDVAAAKEICPCCNSISNKDGLSSVFSPAQSLQGGHEICLHAYRYRIPFLSKKKKKKVKPSAEEQKDVKGAKSDGAGAPPLAVLDFQVSGAPEWVPQSAVVDLEWPSTSKKDMEL